MDIRRSAMSVSGTQDLKAQFEDQYAPAEPTIDGQTNEAIIPNSCIGGNGSC